MTFKGMLTIVVNDFKKQHEQKMFSIVDELMKTRRELREVKEQLHNLQSSSGLLSVNSANLTGPTISLFVQYKAVFNELCDFHLAMTIRQILIKIRQIIGIPLDHQIRICVLSEDGANKLFYLDNEIDRTLESYKYELKSQMILNIEDNEESLLQKRPRQFQRSKSLKLEQTPSYESDV